MLPYHPPPPQEPSVAGDVLGVLEGEEPCVEGEAEGVGPSLARLEGESVCVSLERESTPH